MNWHGDKQRHADRLNHAPDKSETALLLIDVINDLEFAGGELLLRQALPMAKSLAKLKARAKAAGVPVIYANDNFGRWRSDFQTLVQYCMGQNIRGRDILSASLFRNRTTISCSSLSIRRFIKPILIYC